MKKASTGRIYSHGEEICPRPALLEAVTERAAIMEYCGGLARDAAERKALAGLDAELAQKVRAAWYTRMAVDPPEDTD